MSSKRKSYILRLMISIDQFFNVLLLNGSEDHAISGRVGYKALTTQKKRWLYAEKFINTLFGSIKTTVENQLNMTR